MHSPTSWTGAFSSLQMRGFDSAAFSCVKDLQGCSLIFLTHACRVPKGTVDLILSYCHNCLNDVSLVDLLPYFKEKGVGVISASVTSMGLFTKQV